MSHTKYLTAVSGKGTDMVAAGVGSDSLANGEMDWALVAAREVADNSDPSWRAILYLKTGSCLFLLFHLSVMERIVAVSAYPCQSAADSSIQLWTQKPPCGQCWTRVPHCDQRPTQARTPFLLHLLFQNLQNNLSSTCGKRHHIDQG